MARPRQNFRVGRTKRLTDWVGVTPVGYVSVADAGATLLASIPFDEPATVIRTRGQVSITPLAFSVDIEIIGAFGMGVVSSEALAAGILSVPEPFSDSDWAGWFVWRSFSYRYDFTSAVGTQYPRWDFEVDSKAMRKVGSNESIVFVAESFSGAFQISTPVRTLYKIT